MCAQSIDLKDEIAVVTGSGDIGEAYNRRVNTKLC